MDQLIITIIFVISIIAGLATLVTPVWGIIQAIFRYLKYIVDEPFKTKAKNE